VVYHRPQKKRETVMTRKTPSLRPLSPPDFLRDLALRAIQQGIFTNELKPGAVYSEPGLAKQLGISRAPVREALRDLAGRGYFDIIRNKGYRLKGLGAKEIRDIYQFRRIVERAALEEAAGKLAKTALQRMSALVKEAVATRDHLRYLELDRKFHSVIVSLTDNAFIVSAFENLMDMRDWVSAQTLLEKEHMEASRGEHAEIFRLLKRKDTRGATRVMERHLARAEKGALVSVGKRGRVGLTRPGMLAHHGRGSVRGGGPGEGKSGQPMRATVRIAASRRRTGPQISSP
jgi:DNA-binding GntR family transcriptional regulator